MDAMLLSFIAAVLFTGFVVSASDADGEAALIVIPFFSIILAVVIFFSIFFLWRYEYVIEGILQNSGFHIAQEGETSTFSTSTDATLYVMHDGQWVPNEGYSSLEY